MTENLLQKLEEKVMSLVTELENARKELQYSRKQLDSVEKENAFLKADKLNYKDKLQGLVSLLEAVDVLDQPLHTLEPATSYGRMDAVSA